MDWEKYKGTVMFCVILLLVAVIVFFAFTPTGRQIWINDQAQLKKVDESAYENKKDVEDTCRSMIASYKSDVDIYNLYKDSESENQRAYADSAKIRALRTAHQYNEYMLKNSYVWKDNVPTDIQKELETDF